MAHHLLHFRTTECDGAELFSRACCNGTKDNGSKGGLIKIRYKEVFMMRVVKHWNRLAREVVNVPSLETFRVVTLV